MQKVKRYGLSYKGSKNSIADWLIDQLPPAEHFYDLFCGGCAVTHAAMVHQKFKYYHVNDILADVPQLFADACNGKYRNETRWISREDFFALKNTDAYVRLCWSFGNDQRTYLYRKEIEPWKKALHYARVFGDTSLLREFGIDSDGSRKDIEMHHEEYRRMYCKWYGENVNIGDDKHIGELQSLQRLQSLESLQRLERLERLQKTMPILRYCQTAWYIVIFPTKTQTATDWMTAKTISTMHDFTYGLYPVNSPYSFLLTHYPMTLH